MRWVPGEGPVSIHVSDSGLVNESFRVARAGRLYSLRVATTDSQELGLDREWECKVLARAAAAGVAPAIQCCEPAEGVLVADWVPSRAWTAAEIRQPDNIHAMAQLLRRVHALRIPQPARAMSPAAWIAHYSAAFAERPSAELRAAADARLTLLAASTMPAAVLCHSDLHHLNVATGERLLLLDWEYAQLSAPLMDLACVLAYYPTAGRHRSELAAAAGFDAHALQRELSERVYVYRALAWLWHLARGEAAEPP